MFRLFNDEHSGRDRFRSVPDGVEPTDLITKLHSNGDVEFGELNLRDMDPEEIRVNFISLFSLENKTKRDNSIFFFVLDGIETFIYIITCIKN